jgi:glucuronoarabinoxylan endo-1,4-beta-xylanase
MAKTVARYLLRSKSHHTALITFYGNAWTAAAFMKMNANDNNSGYLCSMSGETCTSGDWRQAYGIT